MQYSPTLPKATDLGARLEVKPLAPLLVLIAAPPVEVAVEGKGERLRVPAGHVDHVLGGECAPDERGEVLVALAARVRVLRVNGPRRPAWVPKR